MTYDALADPQRRRDIWHDIAGYCLRWALRRPWKRERWLSVAEAQRYSEMADPPRDWPNGNPMLTNPMPPTGRRDG